MNIIKKKISELKPASYNPRKITPDELDRLKDSIEKFGYVEPIVFNERTGNVCGGHQRLKVLSQIMGTDAEIDVVVVSMDEVQEKALNIALNKTGGSFDDVKLAELLAEIKSIDPTMLNFTGFNVDELNDLLGNSSFGDNEDDADVTKPAKYKVEIGDVFELGNHRVMCGDSTDFLQVQKLMEGAQADLVVTDPPYNVDYTGKTKEALKIDNDKMNNEEFLLFLKKAFANYFEVTKVGGSYYVFHADSEGLNFRTAIQEAGFKLAQVLVWKKDVMVMGRQDYHWKHEPILYGWKEGASHTWNSDRTQTTVLEFDRPTANREHPTMKPLNILMYLIRNNSLQDGLVIDFFGGSGSTLMACEQIQRKCFMMELDSHYCSVIIERFEKATGKIATKNSQPVPLNNDK